MPRSAWPGLAPDVVVSHIPSNTEQKPCDHCRLSRTSSLPLDLVQRAARGSPTEGAGLPSTGRLEQAAQTLNSRMAFSNVEIIHTPQSSSS